MAKGRISLKTCRDIYQRENQVKARLCMMAVLVSGCGQRLDRSHSTESGQSAAMLELSANSAQNPTRSVETKNPMDLVWNDIDGNGFPLNPEWRIQHETGQVPISTAVCGGFIVRGPLHGDWRGLTPTFGSPPCTSIADDLRWDTALGTCQLRRGDWDRSYHGHINWYPVTYTGKLRFEDASERAPVIGPFADKDFNFGLWRPDRAGITDANPFESDLHLEMDRRETLDLFRSGWWGDLASRLKSDEGNARSMFDGHAGSVFGLFGLDGVHDYVTELHPVYAMAVLGEAERQARETWHVFAHNKSMNEGYCSRQEHSLTDLGTDTLRIEIPWHPNAIGVKMLTAHFESYGGSKFGHLEATGHNAAAAVVLPQSPMRQDFISDRPLLYGDMVVEWIIEDGKPALIREETLAFRRYQDVDGANELLRHVISRLTAEQIKQAVVALAQIERAGSTMGQGSAAASTAIILNEPSNAAMRARTEVARVSIAVQQERRDPFYAKIDSILVSMFCQNQSLSPSERDTCTVPGGRR